MPDFLSIEELIIDNSFHNYCFQKKEADIFYWKQYLRDYPSQKEKIEEAKQIVLGLHVMLEQKYAGNKITPNLAEEKNKSHSKIFSVKKIFRYAAAVAAILILILISRKIINVSFNSADKSTNQITVDKLSENIFSYKTANCERKMITLSDNTKIWLNVASELRVDKGFGKNNRNVYLSGEALFDVVHNESLPFIVHTNKYDVKDLGTVFNVKAYPDDKQSETSLIKGKVEIQIANSTRKIFLSPNQKAVINNDQSLVKAKETSTQPLNTQVELLPLSYDQKDSAVIETAWVQNRLEIVNESFAEMKNKLERWYDVKINFKDNEVSKYRFTATFEKESIEEALKALQYAYHFNYSINGDDITISK